MVRSRVWPQLVVLLGRLIHALYTAVAAHTPPSCLPPDPVLLFHPSSADNLNMGQSVNAGLQCQHVCNILVTAGISALLSAHAARPLSSAGTVSTDADADAVEGYGPGGRYGPGGDYPYGPGGDDQDAGACGVGLGGLGCRQLTTRDGSNERYHSKPLAIVIGHAPAAVLVWSPILLMCHPGFHHH